MKRPYLTIISRTAILCAVLALILAHESYRGIITHIHGSESAVPDDPAGVHASSTISVKSRLKFATPEVAIYFFLAARMLSTMLG